MAGERTLSPLAAARTADSNSTGGVSLSRYPAGPGLDSAQDVCIRVVVGHDEYVRRIRQRAHRAGGVDARLPGAESQVHEHEVDRRGGAEGYGFLGGARFADYLDVGFAFEQRS